MKLRVIAVGKLKSRPISELVEDYAARIGRYLPFDILVPKTEDASKIDRDDFLVVCDEHGEEVSSRGLAELILRHQGLGTKRLTFFIGDANGVGKYLLAGAKKVLRLSKMTFPHELARVILLEQLYRACTILKGEKYHYG